MNEKRDLTPSEKMRAALPGDGREQRTSPLLVLLTGALTTFLFVACCICGGGLWWFRPQLHDDPERARELLRKIVEIQIPDSFQPRGTIEWNMAFLNLRGVYYERFVGDGVLTIVEVDTQLSQDDTIRRHIRDTLLDEGSGGTHLIVDNEKTRRENFQIRGQEIPFTIEAARDSLTNRTFHLVEGVFDNGVGQVLLHLRVDDEHWKDEPGLSAAPAAGGDKNTPAWVTNMLNSIGKTPGPPLPVSTQPEAGNR